jgi:ribonuclease III
MKELLVKLLLPYKDESIYLTALTHASYANEFQVEKNERLEFLGDAVIELLMSSYLYKEDLEDEGVLTKKRAQAVREEALVKYADQIDLKSFIRIGKGEMIKGPNDAMIADAFEALFGATFVDLGFIEAKKLFQRIIVPHLHLVWGIKDYKTTLQEIIHSGDKRNISYHIIKQSGPSHDKEFEAVVKLDQHIVLGVGIGKTKKEAEQNAAKEALKKGQFDVKETL